MAKSVFRAEEAEKVAITYTPRKFPQVIAPVAKDFVAFQSSSEKTDFRIDTLVAKQTGISDLERVSIEQQVEIEALTRLKEIQEKAYEEAYSLGRDEGREDAFKQHDQEIQKSLQSLETLLKSIENLKADLVTFNEAHIIQMIYYMASRVAMMEIEHNQAAILNVLKLAIEGTQAEETVNVKVSQSDLSFIQSMQEKGGRDLEFLKRIRLETSENIKAGGCIVETNYGVVDATLEQRMIKLWESLKDKLPKVKDKVATDGEGGT